MISAVGCCAFAGGFTWGLRAAGITPIATLEFPGVNGHVKTHRQNFPDVPVYDKGPANWPVKALASLAPNVLYAQPPCAPWSHAGFGPNRGINKHRTDPRVQWTKEAFKLVEKLEPEVFIYESVQNTFHKIRHDFFDPFALDCNLDGMSCYHVLHDGARVGLPHHRKRYFFIASRYELLSLFNEPEPRHVPTSLETLEKINVNGHNPVWPRSVDRKTWDGNLGEIEPGQSLLQAWTLRNPPDKWVYGSRNQVVGRPAFGNYRLHPDKPPRTFYGSYTLIHPTEDRPLTMPEIKAIAGYPPEFDLSATSSQGAAMVQMGQAVLPPVAEWIGRIIKRDIRAGVRAYGSTAELDYC
jgi:site-specific DNA-cytosine methylase